MKQVFLFNDEFEKEENSKYNKSINAPIYEPKNKKPHPIELYDNTTPLIINEKHKK